MNKNIKLLRPEKVDLLFKYPSGRTKRLAKAGKIPFIKLPDGEIRFDERVISRLISPERKSVLGGHSK